MLHQSDGTLTEEDSEVAIVIVYLMIIFVTFILKKTYQLFLLLILDYMTTYYQILLLYMKKFSISYVNSTHINLLVLINVILMFTCNFGKPSCPLTLHYNISLKQGILPDAWKEAIVIAFHKKGSKQQACNYRPISLTSVICKMLEAIIKEHIMNHLLTHNLLSDYQHGFCSGKSCETQLLRVMNAWMESLESHHEVDIIDLVFQKAFDKVSHEHLLAKVKSFGITGCLLPWIQNYLYYRKQRACVHDSLF